MSDVTDAGAETVVPVIEIGGSHATAATVVLSGASASVQQAESELLDPALAAEALLDAFAAPALRLLDGPTGARADRWAVAMPGPFDYDRGIGVFEAVGKFEALRDVSVRAGLAARLGVDDRQVVFVNDAAAYALGEWAFGSDSRARRHVCVTLGTGVGSAFLADGRVVADGDDVPPHGWAYRLEYDGRPLEDTVSTRAIVRRYAERTGRLASVKDIAAAARAEDADAVAVLDEAMSALGLTLAPWLRSFGADRLTVGGSMVRSWPVLVGALGDGLARGGAPDDLELMPSSLLDHAPVLGAAVWRRSLDSSPDPVWSDHR